MHRTEKALIARGCDSQTAATLRNAGWTLKKLKLAPRTTLKKLGLRSQVISAIKTGERPPIPDDALKSLLFKARFQCCICRDPKKGIVIHHIEEWSKSGSHEESNLVVLCLDHHSKAHSKSTLERNLDGDTLRRFKAQWEAEVVEADKRSIIAASAVHDASWGYFNELRLIEISRSAGFKLNRLRHFSSAYSDGIIDKNGLLRPVSPAASYLYDGVHILTRYSYMKDLFDKLLDVLHIRNISDYLDKGIIQPSIAIGDFILVQGKFVFSPLTQKISGKGQHCQATRKANGVRVQCVFDRWEATSMSAFSVWLRGTNSSVCLIQVKDISRDGEDVVVSGTALAIGTGMNELKTREYAKNMLGGFTPRFDDDEEGEDDDDF